MPATKARIKCPDCADPLRGDGSCCDHCGWTWHGGGDDPRLPSLRTQSQIIDAIQVRRARENARKNEGRKLREELVAHGAKLETREDRQGETLKGWWLDGVFLGETVPDALEAIGGG